MEDPLGFLSPAEVEFVAEDTPITITPNFQAGVFLFLKVVWCECVCVNVCVKVCLHCKKETPKRKRWRETLWVWLVVSDLSLFGSALSSRTFSPLLTLPFLLILFVFVPSLSFCLSC